MGGGGIVGTVARGLGDVATFGTNELLGNPIGKAASSLANGPQQYNPQMVPNSGNDPLSTLVSNGGAPLLGQISMGVNVNDALAGYFGQTAASFPAWLAAQDQQTQNAINGVSNQLTQVQNNTQLQQTAVNNLVKDFPNMMQTMIPQYSSIMSDATKQMMNQAIQTSAAQYAAGGQVSSGAATLAAAQVGAQYAQSDINYGTNLANQDWSQQYQNANAQLGFQQKMLGQGAQNGFSAAQNALNRTQQNNITNTGAVNQANAANAAQSNNMYNSLLGLGGTAAIYGLRNTVATAPMPNSSPTSSPTYGSSSGTGYR